MQMSELGERLTIGVTKTYKELQEMVISFVANREGSKEIILCQAFLKKGRSRDYRKHAKKAEVSRVGFKLRFKLEAPRV